MKVMAVKMGSKRRVAALALMAFLVFGILDAQTAKLDYGFKAGFSLAQHYAPIPTQEEYLFKTAMRPGAVAGFWLDMRILPHFALGYEALYTMKGSREHITILEMDGEELAKPAVMNISYDLDYMEIPVLLKVRTLDTGKFALDGIVGTAMGIKLRSRHELDGIFYLPDGDGFAEFPVAEESDLSEVNMFDYSMVYGTMLRYDGKVNLSAELRFTLGWDYLQLPTFSLGEAVELRNQTYSAIIGLEF